MGTVVGLGASVGKVEAVGSGGDVTVTATGGMPVVSSTAGWGAEGVMAVGEGIGKAMDGSVGNAEVMPVGAEATSGVVAGVPPQAGSSSNSIRKPRP